MESKTCSKCNKERLISEFDRNRAMRDGHLSVCKACTKIARRKYYLENRDRVLLGNRNYKINNLVAIRKSRVNWRAKNKDLSNKLGREYRARNIEKTLARGAVQVALLNGSLVRPSVCERCRDDKSIEAHHPDYSQRLLIEWLCKICHSKEHRGDVSRGVAEGIARKKASAIVDNA